MNEAAASLIERIGWDTILAVANGRIRVLHRPDGSYAIRLAAGFGHAVEIEPDGMGTYTVTRSFTRKGVRQERGVLRRVKRAELADVAYRASCYRDPFGAEA